MKIPEINKEMKLLKIQEITKDRQLIKEIQLNN